MDLLLTYFIAVKRHLCGIDGINLTALVNSLLGQRFLPGDFNFNGLLLDLLGGHLLSSLVLLVTFAALALRRDHVAGVLGIFVDLALELGVALQQARHVLVKLLSRLVEHVEFVLLAAGVASRDEVLLVHVDA